LTHLESRQVRLIVSLPALMLLYSVLVALLLRLNLTEVAEGLPEGEARQQTEFLADLILWLGTAGAVAAGGIGVLLAWQIVRPLRQLISNMRYVMEGGLPPHKVSTHIGEIGQLGSTFNQMVDHLRELFEKRDKQMRESSAGSLLSLDSAGRILAADEDIAAMLGTDLQGVLGRRLDEVITLSAREPDPEFEQLLREQVADAIDGKPANATVEIHLRGRDQPTLFSFSFQPMASAGPAGPACTVDLRDLSAMREFYIQMQRADRLAALGTLAAGIAHEIRNPLASIRGMTQLLDEDIGRTPPDEDNPSASRDYLRRIQNEIDRLDRLVHSIMDFANIREGHAVPVDINAVLREAFETCRHSVQKSEEASLRFEWHLERKLPEVPLERERFQQALLNLVRNALEAVAEDGGVIRFETRLLDQRQQRPVVIRISNSGYISPERRERLFEPFYTTRESGTGLGLPITYQIITGSNGEIELTCDDDMVTFSVYLPLDGQLARLAPKKSRSSTHLLKFPLTRKSRPARSPDNASPPTQR
jgi:nitrogen-specific signal transduction histidine kinase/HAMP domain-containing protein